MPESYIDRHIELLLAKDPIFQKFWSEMEPNLQSRYRKIWFDIERQTASMRLSQGAHLAAMDPLRRWFTRVQEKEFEFPLATDEWKGFVRDLSAKQAVYDAAKSRLQAFINRYFKEQEVRLYGGLKSTQSIEMKLSGNEGKAGLMDLWDVVRFRIVVLSVDNVLKIGIAVWEVFFVQVLRCRNFYYRPRGNSRDPYRAVHFILLTDERRVIELQIMSERRDAISLIDHRFVFKGTLQFLNEKHEAWLNDLSLAANLLDADEACRPCDSTLSAGQLD